MILEVRNISKQFNNNKVLDDINITLNEGELVSLIGASGGGKTTLFNIVSGIISPDEGEVLLANESIVNKPGNVSYMLQNDMLLPYKKVIDNVALPLVIRGEKKKEARKIVAPYFEKFGLAGYEMSYPGELSGGMKQRASFLRTYMMSKKVALLDEPFSALDTISKKIIRSWYIDVMNKIELSTLFITHDIDEAILLSDRIYILSKNPGRIADEIKIDVPRSERSDFELTDKFLNYKKMVTKSLKII